MTIFMKNAVSGIAVYGFKSPLAPALQSDRNNLSSNQLRNCEHNIRVANG